MAKSDTAAFAQDPKISTTAITDAISLSGANSLETETCANTHLLFTAGAEGAIVNSIYCVPRGSITGTVAYLFLRKASDSGSIRRVLRGENITAKTASATSAVNTYRIGDWTEAKPLRLDAGDELYIGLTVAQAVGVVAVAEAVDF